MHRIMRRAVGFSAIAAPFVAVMMMSGVSANADSIDRATLLAEAPERCAAAASERYGVDVNAVIIGSKPTPKYHSGLKGVAVPLKVTQNNRQKRHTCVALKNGRFDFYQGTH